MRILDRLLGARLALALAAVAAIGISTGCGGGAASSGPDGSASVLLTDAPMITVNGRHFTQLNVDITAFEASIPGTRSFTSVPFTTVAAVTTVNILDLNNDQEWLAYASLPPGDYDAFRITIDPASANLVEAGTGTVQPLTVTSPTGELVFRIRPPLRIDPARSTLFVIDWKADRSVSYDAASGEYRLAGVFETRAIAAQTVPVPFRALPGVLTTIDLGSGELRLRLERHSAASYLVRTNPTGNTPAALVDAQGNAIALTDLSAGDRVIVSGTVDGNLDVDATRVMQLPASFPGGGSGHGGNAGQPSPGGRHHGPGAGNGGGHNGGGHNGGHNGGGNPGGGGGNTPSAPAAGAAVFAMGVVHALDTSANTFEVSMPYLGAVRVLYDDATTQIIDATVRPPQIGSEADLSPATPSGDVTVQVIGAYVPPASATSLPAIDATGAGGAPGRIAVIRRR
jgi:hypothetical protein